MQEGAESGDNAISCPLLCIWRSRTVTLTYAAHMNKLFAVRQGIW